MTFDDKKTVTDDSDCGGCVGDEDGTKMMHKHKTAGILTL